MSSIKVYVIDKGRKNLYLMYRDPDTGDQVTRSAKTRNRRDAERAAAKWESEILSGGMNRSKSCTMD